MGVEIKKNTTIKIESREEDNFSPELKARRLKSARLMTGLSAEQFARNCNLPAPTLRAWEKPNGRQGLTPKGAQKLSSCFFDLGIKCEPAWLLNGDGEGPKIISYKQKTIFASKDSIVMKEACLFEELNENSIVYLVPDDSMSPLYSKDDIIGGIKTSTIRELLNYHAIVKLKNNPKVFLRTIIQSKKEDRFDLKCLNYLYPYEDNFVKNAEIEFVAKVVWHRTRG